MNYVVAVSGGVDSVVLLDALQSCRMIAEVNPWGDMPKGEMIVAHFDHGIRDDSAADEEFVRGLARQYGCRYESRRESLGKGTSEETARQRRYAFLHDVCRRYGATLVTAHHADDVVETVAINITRGTGWRGLAVMDMPQIWRPLLDIAKDELRQYAATHRLSWREDSTNTSDAYLRNRLRKKLNDSDMTWQIAALRARQVELKHAIDTESAVIIGQAPYSRYFFTHCGDTVAFELLRAVVMAEAGRSLPLPARQRMLQAVKTARAGATTHIYDGVVARFTTTHFVVESGVEVI